MKSIRLISPASRAARLFGAMALLIAFALPPGASAQSSVGAVSGRVLNQTTGEYLQGALVHVVGTDLRSSTDLQGYYAIRNVPEGVQTIRVSYLGLGSQTQTVDVSADVSPRANFNLQEDVVELEGVRVEAELSGRSSAINQQRVASGIKNIVNQDDFGQMNDGNIGMALRRMPGLSVDTDGGTEVPRYVNIRGFDASLNSVTLDGNRLASSESGSPSQRGSGTAYGGAARSFALDDLSADSITNVEIVKAPTPDMDGAALGGSVNLITKSAFERSGRSVDYRFAGSYSELRGEWGYNVGATYSDLYDAFGGESNFGVSATISRYDQNEGFDNIDYDWNYVSTSFDDVDLSGVAFDGPLNDYLEPQLAQDRERTGQLAIAFNEDTEYNNFEIDRQRDGISAAFELKLNDRTQLYFKPTYNHEKRVIRDFRHHLIMDSSDVVGLNHGDAATPLNQWVSLHGAFDPAYDAGNYAAFRAAAIAANRASEDFQPGDAIGDLTFDPGALVRLGNDPGRISTWRPGSGDQATSSTYNPDGSARGQARYEGTFREEIFDFINLSLGGKTETDWGAIEYGAYYSSNEKEAEEFQQEFQRRGFQFAYTRDSEDPYVPDYMTVNPVSRFDVPSSTGADRFRDLDLEQKMTTNSQEFVGAHIDVEYILPTSDRFSATVKGGARWVSTDYEHDYDEREWNMQESGANRLPFEDYLYFNDLDGPYGEDRTKIPYVPDAPRIYRDAILGGNSQWIQSEQFSDNLYDSIVQDYTASEDTQAYYLMAEVDVGKLNIIFGGRYEKTDFETSNLLLDENYRVDPTAVNPMTLDESTAVSGSQNRKRSYDQFLPSLHLKYELAENLIGRMSLGKTYARPAVKDMVGQVIVTEESASEIAVSIPNFDLEPQESNNFDVSMEYYTQSGRYGAGYFRKDMTNYAWSESFETTSYPGYEGITAVVSQPVANTDAVNQGIELFVDQKLTFLPEFFHPFSLMGSYTYTDSAADYYTGRVGPTIGHSMNMYTLALAYDRGPFFARAIWQYRSPYFENISISDFAEESEALAPESQFIFDDTFMNPGTLDLEFGYDLADNVELFMNVTNVTEGINASRQGYFQYPEDSYPHQRRWTIGIKGRF